MIKIVASFIMIICIHREIAFEAKLSSFHKPLKESSQTLSINAKPCQDYPDEAIADAIFKAEGGLKAQYYYGIRSVKYKDIAEARRICLNTIRNQRARHMKHQCKKSYLECLASRYCPINCDNDRGTNKFWLKNVTYFLRSE